MINIVWLKRDLRLYDHKPLYQATREDLPTILLYVQEPEYWQLSDTSARHWSFICQCLKDINQQLASSNTGLWIAQTDIISCFQQLQMQYGIRTIFSHEETGNNWTYRRDKRVQQWCNDNQVRWRQFTQFAVKRGPLNRDQWDAVWQQRMNQPIQPEADFARLMPPHRQFSQLTSDYPGDDKLFCTAFLIINSAAIFIAYPVPLTARNSAHG